MRLQLKVPRGLTFGLATAASVRRSAVYSSPRPPDGPSCSRWVSCSCCRRDDTPFFSRNDRRVSYSPHATQSFTSQKSSIFIETVAATDGTPRQTASRPQLPLPPTLPYSPDSVPFQRHLQHLSLAVLSSDPDDSWRSYLALHKSLRRYIPDDLFRNLLAHQLSNPHAKQSWVRGLALIKFAKRCGVEARNLGEENLRNALRAGFDLVLKTKVSDFRRYLPELKALWVQLKATSTEVPVDLRKGYLRIHCKRTAKNKDERMARAHDALREVIGLYGTAGIEREAGKIVSLYDESDASLHVESLRLAAWCAEQGLELPDDAFLVMLRLHQLWTTQGREAMFELRRTVQAVVGAPAGLEFLRAVLADIEDRYRSPTQRTVDAISSRLPVPQLTRETLELLATDTPDLDVVLDALASLTQREAEVAAIVTAVLHHLDRRPSTDTLIRALPLLLETDTLDQLRLDHLRAILRLLVSALPSEQAYTFCRKVYAVARQREYRWTHADRKYWHTLFHHAVHPTRRHLHFASRLYADLQHDGLAIHLNDHLALIRAIGMSRSDSRPILLERHIRDFMQTANAATPTSFIVALVTGLTSSKDAHDASIAFDLSRRILHDRPFPLEAAQLLIPRLAASSNLAYLRKAVLLLDFCPTAEAYNHVIFSIVAHSKVEARANQMSRTEALSQAVGMYKRMVDRKINTTPRTVSLLLRALVDARHVEAAINVFEAAADNGVSLKPNAVGRLMVRLILDDKLDRAVDIETKWRQATSTVALKGKTYDRAIVGARVLLDIKRGVHVDLGEIARKTGWTGTAPFLRFIETLKPDSSVAETRSQLARSGDVGAETSTMVRPAASDPPPTAGRLRRPWIRSDNDRQRSFDADSMVAVRSGVAA